MKIIGRNFPLSFSKISGWSAFMKVHINKEIKMDLCCTVQYNIYIHILTLHSYPSTSIFITIVSASTTLSTSSTLMDWTGGCSSA